MKIFLADSMVTTVNGYLNGDVAEAIVATQNIFFNIMTFLK